MRRLARPVLVIAVVATAITSAPVVAQGSTEQVPPPDIVPFEVWAPAACPAPSGTHASATDRVVVHHSHHPVAATPDQVLPALAELCRLHVARGFESVGYHYVVDPWGTVYQGRGGLPAADGSAPTAQPEGAHVHGSNPGATGVVFLGDHEHEPPTPAAVDTAVRLLAWLVEATGRDPGELVAVESTGGGTALHEGTVEVELLAGHNTTNATLCPGQHLIELLEPIRDRVRATIAGDVGALRITDGVQPAPPPDGVAHITNSGPIVAAPPPEPPLGSRAGLLGLLPITALALPLLHLVGRAHGRRAPTHGQQPTQPDVWSGWS